MPDEQATNYWNMEVGTLVRRLRERQGGAEEASGHAPEEAASPEARLRVVPRDRKFLDFYSTLHARRLFSVPATLNGTLSKFTQVEAASGRRVVVTVPVALAGGENLSIKVTFYLPRGVEPGQDLELTRAGQGKLPPDTRLLEFLFTGQGNEFRYVVELDQRVEVLDFEEVVDQRPVFLSVPPVGQMTAFLRAITHKRRTSLDILGSLMAAAGPQAQESIRILQSQRRHQDVPIPQAAVVSHLLEHDGRIVSQQVLQAFTLFLDMETGGLTPAALERGGEVGVSAEAVLLVAEHFGLTLTSATWAAAFPDEPRPLEEIRKAAQTPELARALEILRAQRDRRTPLEILEQIAQESNSRRAATFAAGLRERLPEGRTSLNDEQLALLALLSAAGRRYQANTLVALCLFVDAEVGFLTEADLDNLSRAAETVDTSMYAMVAVAGAFDVQLRGLVLEETPDEPLDRSLPALVELAPSGLLAGFRVPGQSGHHWHWIRSAREAALCLQDDQLQFTGMVLGALPILDQVAEPDLAILAESGHDLVGVFQSDLDRALVWRRLGSVGQADWRSAPVDGRRVNFSFLDGFSAFHFSRVVLAFLEPVEAADLVGRRQVVAVYLDNRQNRHFRCLAEVGSVGDLEPPEGSGLVFSHQIVGFPDLSGLPGTMRELGQDALLGRTDSLSSELRLLEWIHETLWLVLTRLPDYQSLTSRPDVLERIRKSLWSSRASDILGSLMDPRTRDDLSRNLKGSSAMDFRLYRPLLEAGDGQEKLEFAGLRIMYEMCRSDLVGVEGYYKHYDANRFRALIHNRLMEMLDAPEAPTRAMAMRLLATSEEVPDTSVRLVVEYELARGLSDPDPGVGRAAAEGLLRLCLMEKVPLPEMVDLLSVAVDEDPLAASDEPMPTVAGVEPDEIRRLDGEIRKWIKGMKTDDPRRAASLPLTDELGEILEERLQPLVELLAALNSACRADESLSRRRYFCIISNQELETVRGAWLDSWKIMALSLERRLADLVAEASPAEIFLDYRFFVEDHVDELKAELGATPYLSGPDQPLTLYHLRPGEDISLFRRRDSSFVAEVMEESRLFLDLMERVCTSEPRSIRVLRLSTVGGMALEDLESHLAVFTLTRAVDLRTAEVFQLHRVRFNPMIHDMAFSPEQVGSREEDLEDLHALLGLIHGRKATPAARHAAAAPEPAPPPEPPAPEPDPPGPSPEIGDLPGTRTVESDLEGIRHLAAEIVRAFGLPEEMERQVVNMLLVVGRSSMYDL